MSDDESGVRLLSVERGMIANAKKLSLLALGVAAQKYGPRSSEEQQVLGNIADIIIETYAMESS